jgi:cytochrome c peroxidase
MKKAIFIFSALGVFTIYSCTRSIQIAGTNSETPNLPTAVYDYQGAMLPNNTDVKDFAAKLGGNGTFNPFGNVFDNGVRKIPAVTNDGATLGRVLFYDKKMSLNNTVACGTCHHQDKAFTDGQAFSKGFEGRITTRNTMAICNPIMQNNLFWDSRSNDLQDLALRPITNHIEMGMDDLDKLEKKLAATSYYPNLFQKAFGSSEITREKISIALSQFVASITTADSKFDKNRMISNQSGQPTSIFTPLETMGQVLFNANCTSCHAGDNMVADDGPSGSYGGGGFGNGGNVTDKKGSTNIGLDFVYTDNGMGNGNFKIPSLRNIGLTAPYMHDGRFKTLEEVLNHYANGIKPHANLDPKFKGQNSAVKMIDLSKAEQMAVIAFLNTLTDYTMVNDAKYSDPFKK